MKFTFVSLVFLSGFLHAQTQSLWLGLDEGLGIMVEYEVGPEEEIILMRVESNFDRPITNKDKLFLIKESEQPNSSIAKRIYRWFLVFVPSGEAIKKFVRKHFLSKIVNLCDRVGEKHKGRFSRHGFWVKAERLVGDYDSECFGKCGPGCNNFFSRNTYTQACFDHDLCHRIGGEQLGECSDEFWEASDDYLNGPKCSRGL